jgi:hypothetical protein
MKPTIVTEFCRGHNKNKMLSLFIEMTKQKASLHATGASMSNSPYGSPSGPSGRRAKGFVKVITPDRPKRSCVCKIMGLQGNLAALFFEKAPGDDAFHLPIKEAMESNTLNDDGFVLLTNRRISSSRNETMSNANSSFPRKIYIVMMDDNTAMTRNDVMQAACRIMNLPQNNKYAIPYVIDETSDLTGNVFPKVDEWVLDRQVIDIIRAIYDNVTSNWAQLHASDASYFFSGPPYCQVAIQTLGYSNEN